MGRQVTVCNKPVITRPRLTLILTGLQDIGGEPRAAAAIWPTREPWSYETTGGPRITVVTVCLNAVASIERTLSSVVGQDYPFLEYVIVDGGSTDGTVDIIRRYETRLAAWSSEPDRGISDAFNKGIRRATGEVIGLVSADDYLPEGTLQRVAAAWLAAARPDVLYGNSLVVYPDGSGAATVHPDRDFSAVWRRTPVKHSSTWIARCAYERFGGYSPRWRLAMDYELILRFQLRGARFHCEDAVLGAFQLGGRNDVAYRAAARELRDISIHYGYHAKAACTAAQIQYK